MDVFQSRYYKVNCFFLKLLGLWPFSDPQANRTKRIVIVVAIITLTIPMYIRLVEDWRKDMNVMVELLSALAYLIVSKIKFISCFKAESKTKYLYTSIRDQWKSVSCIKEKRILKEYAEIGRFLTIGYIIPLNLIFLGYMGLPLTPMLLDIIQPLNATRQRDFPYYSEYFVDEQLYYFQLSLHGWIVFGITVQICGTFDSINSQCCQHICALFDIVELRLQKATSLAASSGFCNEREKERVVYDEIVDAVRLHKEAINLFNLLQDSYSICHFIVTLLNALTVTSTAVITGDIKHAARFVMLYVGVSFHMIYNMFPWQQVFERSDNIRNAAFHSYWYNVCPRSRQLIKIIILRSAIPCQFIAGKFILMNLENFAFVFKNSMSLVTVLASMQ